MSIKTITMKVPHTGDPMTLRELSKLAGFVTMPGDDAVASVRYGGGFAYISVRRQGGSDMKKVRAFNKLVQGGAAETTKIAMLALGVRGVYDE